MSTFLLIFYTPHGQATPILTILVCFLYNLQFHHMSPGGIVSLLQGVGILLIYSKIKQYALLDFKIHFLMI